MRAEREGRDSQGIPAFFVPARRRGALAAPSHLRCYRCAPLPGDDPLARLPAPALSLALCCALLGACGAGDRDATTAAPARGDAEAPLPKPEAAKGSVTGMPDAPGPGPVGDAVAETPVEAMPEGAAMPSLGEAGADAGAGATDGVQPLPPPAEAQAGEPSVADAVAVVQEYYGAIAAREFPRAYALWSDGGRASGQDPKQFAAGFADTASVQVDVGAPGRVEGAAGSRYVEVPVSVAATRRDGSVHRYVGAYTLRRAVVDGASDEQRAWRIASADLREVRP